ncbi:MAG: ArsR family transcriptional regulator [Anaerolineae bacterium]|nr:ArsR family transcriptional regulator [Anaerolineae bacterium]
MPFQVIETTDPLTNLVRFTTSPVFEMITSLHLVLNPKRRAEWATATREQLSPEFLRELQAVYGPFQNGFFFFELGIESDDHSNVPGFIDMIRTMSPVRFIFYLVGRVISEEQIAATGLTRDAIEAVLAESPYGTYCMCQEVPFDTVLDDVPAFQNRLADLWQWYWEDFFHTQIDILRPHWDAALTDKNALLAHEGGEVLFDHVTGKKELPPPLPADHPVVDILFVPVYLTASSVYMFYGYGNVTVLFDSERTQARIAEIEQGKERAIMILKALGDGSRLEIARLVAQNEGKINGKKIAAKLNLSASAVSRHLAQLRDAGVITEEAQDNRERTYHIVWDAIRDLPRLLKEYMHH